MTLRIASLQPSISIILDRLGCLHRLVACTRYCVEAVPALRNHPVAIVKDSWSTNTDELLATAPNLVLASVPYRLESLAAILKAGVAVLALAPHSLNDIASDISHIGRLVGSPTRAVRLVEEMQQQMDDIRRRAACATSRPLVYAEEWGKPLIHSQAWVDELIEAAGGTAIHKAGQVTDAATIAAADPDILLFAWCGAGDRVPLEKIIAQRGWSKLRSVRERRVYCIPDEWLNTPAPTLIHGLRAIAACLHPSLFGELQVPRRLQPPQVSEVPSNMK